jgi:hypothetical protein
MKINGSVALVTSANRGLASAAHPPGPLQTETSSSPERGEDGKVLARLDQRPGEPLALGGARQHAIDAGQRGTDAPYAQTITGVGSGV